MGPHFSTCGAKLPDGAIQSKLTKDDTLRGAVYACSSSMGLGQIFLSYNSIDRPSVVALQKLLETRGIRTFLDRDQLVPGLPWPVALEEGLRGVRAVAVFIGRELGGWQKREMWFALDRQVREEKE